ncbi:MAG: heme NO-binding domain-containing protein [Bacteroidia bacterium]|nr:heme NO-binding domain-containing protein [Bacteroidia bacterium]
MKGIVFTEFLEMVEEKFGFVTADAIVQDADLPSGGIYTAVGTYPHAEIVALVVQLSQKTSIPIPSLLQAFGQHLFPKFVQGYGGFFQNVTDPFVFLSSLENYIHVEVKKLYPDAELPSFDSHFPDEKTLVMEYRSARGMADFALGLLEGCLTHFQDPSTITREDLAPNGSHTRFVLTRP